MTPYHQNGKTTMRLGPKRYIETIEFSQLFPFSPPPPTITQIKGDKQIEKEAN